MNNIQSFLNMGSSFLKENHINSYQIDSELLLSKVLNKNREYMCCVVETSITTKTLIIHI